MNGFEFTALVFSLSLLAGFIGSLTGLGGGVLLTPVLTLFLGVDIRYAIGASLVSVIATSSGSATAYVRAGLANIRVGMFLEIATTLGALLGAYLSTYVPVAELSGIFGLVLLWTAWQTSRSEPQFKPPLSVDPLAEKLSLNGTYPTDGGVQRYVVGRIKTAFVVMFGAGTLSGLLGIGSGSLKVFALDQAMRMPFKVSAATSSFMIGVTAAASASLYLSRGYIDPAIAMPVMLGVLGGSMVGTRLFAYLSVVFLRRLFAVAVGAIGIQMLVNAFRGNT